MTPNKYFLCLLLISMISSGLAGCSQENVNASLSAPPPPSVTVSHPLQKHLTHFTEFTGTIEALDTVQIRARVEGILHQIHFIPGALVEKGQLLYSIDPAAYQAGLEEALANLAMQKAALQLARATSLRREKAYKDKAVSEVAVIQATAETASARAGVKSAQAALKMASLALSYTRVTAPISGRVGLSRVDSGNLVGAGERTLLTTIIRDDKIYAYFTVNERDLLAYRQVMEGKGAQPSPARIDTPVFLGLANQTDYPHEGVIDYVHNRMDTAGGTIRVRGIFQNPDHRLLPGLYARIKIPLGSPRKELLVPDTAVSRDQKGHYLLVADKDNKVRYQPVTTGPRVDGLRVIRQGLLSTDRVIVNGIQKARPGMPVTPMEKDISTAADRKTATPAA